MSSSSEISLRVLGRSVELLLDVDSEEPLEGFMACGHRAAWVRVELHRPDGSSDREDAWHRVTGAWLVTEGRATAEARRVWVLEMW